ncbi:sugar phosphate isomerase/epimerase family protein [Olivibacter sitiensis]|uniref:sugar phosphate isomerase/epimerase family protein n=1 Tax=Olivibacter sitiensis TaxID=376470 RepID=UPI0003FB982C|nr:sugar phosphate isomerase/epimerase [Olivibacter sitiensis]
MRKSFVLFALSVLCVLAVMPTYSQDMPEKKLGWKLGTQAYSFRLFSFAEAIAKTDSCGLRYIEAFPGQTVGAGITDKMGPELSKEQRGQVLQMLKDKNVELVAFGVTNGNSEEEWVRIFEFAKEMGIKNINTEPKQEQLPMIGKLADKYKIKVSIHNHPKPTPYWNPDTVLKAIALANSPYVGACADIGHWVRSGLDPVACIAQYKGHINHLHFKDLNEKDPKAHDVHWGTGVSNVRGVLQALKDQGFKGMLSAEYEYNWEDNAKDIAISATNFRAIVKELK